MQEISPEIKRGIRKKNFKRRGLVFLFTSPFFISFLFFIVVPLCMGLIFSFFNYNSYNIAEAKFVGFNNYIKIFNGSIVSRTFWPALWTTLKFDFIAVPIMLFIPLALAYLVSLEPKGYKIYRALIYLPSVVSISIAGVIFGAIFSDESTGLINALFHTNIQFMSNQALRWTIIMIVSIWWQTGTNFVILLAAIKSVPKSLYEACEIDGGKKWSSFRYVTLPNIAGQLGLCTFTTLTGYLGLYGQVITINSYANRNALETPMVMIQQWVGDFAKADLAGQITAVAVVFGLITILFTTIQRIVMRDKKSKGDRYENEFKKYSSQKI